MLGLILLRGKEFTIPDDASTAIIGLFFGLVCGLFYYQHYYKQYYWAISLGGGLVLTYVSHWIFSRSVSASDDASSLPYTLVSVILPFLLTLALNHGLYLFKRHKRKRRQKRKPYSNFFDTIEGDQVPKVSGQGYTVRRGGVNRPGRTSLK